MSLVPLQALVTNASATDLWNEQTNFVGTVIESTGYGAHLVLYIMCMQLLLRGNNGRIAWWSVAFITAMFVLNTLVNGLNIRFNTMMFVLYRGGTDGPTGPLEFLETQFSDVISVAGFACYVVGLWMQDGLLLYRFFIIFGSRYVWAILPGMLYLTTVAMSCIFLFQLSQPLATIWQHNTADFAEIFWSLSIGLNILLTSSICARLLIQRKRMTGLASTPYGSIAAMIVESAALYTVVAIVFLATFVQGSFVQNLALGVLAPAQSIAPLLIIYRVAEGRAWNRSTANGTWNGSTTVASMKFTPGGSGASRPHNIPLNTVNNSVGSYAKPPHYPPYGQRSMGEDNKAVDIDQSGGQHPYVV